MSALQIIVFALATWRISSLFVNENGPWFIFERLRIWSGIYYRYPDHKVGVPLKLEDLQPAKIVPDRFFSQLLDCVWCCSMYVGLFWTALFYFFPAIAPIAALPFALSTCAILLNLLVERLK